MNAGPETTQPQCGGELEEFASDIGRRRMLMMHARMQERHAMLQEHRTRLQALSTIERMSAQSEILVAHNQKWGELERRLQAECEGQGHLPWSPLPGQTEPNFDGSWSTHCARCWKDGPRE